MDTPNIYPVLRQNGLTFELADEITSEKTLLVHVDFHRLPVHQEGFLSKWCQIRTPQIKLHVEVHSPEYSIFIGS